MPYIGKSPVTGNYNSLDDMSGSFNSSTTTFNLLVNSGTALTPVRAEALIISLNGVIQEPGADFTVSAATITYTTAPASTDSFFGVVLGQQLDIATPGDGTVSTAKIADGAVNMAKLGSALTDIADGTVTSPTIANSGDTNTGLYWPAADTLGVTAFSKVQRHTYWPWRCECVSPRSVADRMERRKCVTLHFIAGE